MIEFLKDLSLWYNLIFTLPILFVILYLILQVFGLALDFGADVDTDAGEVDFDIDTDADTGIDDIPDFERALAFINVGKVPLTIVVSTFLLFWGITGFACNGIIKRGFGSFPSVFVLVSCAAALFVGIIATKFLSGIIARVFPEVETYSSNNEALLGLPAKVVSGQVTSKFGRAKVKDQYGNVLTVFCKISEGKEVPKRGDEVVLVDYDPSDSKFEVARMDVE